MNLWPGLLREVNGAVRLEGARVQVVDEAALRRGVAALARKAALGTAEEKSRAQWLLREAAQALGIYPASIHGLYVARGRGEVPPVFTVPALNLRVLPFYAARAVFRVAKEMGAAAFIFEIARSEIGYTDQRPAEYAAQIFAAAIAEGWRGPVFLQGDHFQVSPGRYAEDPEAELQAVRDLIAEAIEAGFFNIDVDTSTLVDITQPTVEAQQALNVRLSAELTAYLRTLEPREVTVSVGGEIGEVGGHNSTEPELRAYMEGFNAALAERAPDAPGLSKISIQTGTSHGGVVLPDGTLAEVRVDFDTLRHLSRIARQDYGLGGAVQHGASTLPESAFGKFPEAEAVEIHLATNFMNIAYDHLPTPLREEMYAYIMAHYSEQRKPEMSDQQFFYKFRKYAVGPFKAALWDLPEATKTALSAAWEAQFRRLFTALRIADTQSVVGQYVPSVVVPADLSAYLRRSGSLESAEDLAD